MSDIKSSAAPAVAIVLVNWNGWRHTLECVDSLLALEYPDFHVFVVDNDSADGSVGRMEAWCANPIAEPHWMRREGVRRWTDSAAARRVPFRTVNKSEKPLEAPAPGCRITFVRSGANLGYAGGANVGVRAAGLSAYEYIWFVNTDTVVCSDALRRLVERARQDARIGMVGSTLLHYERPDVIQCLAGARIDPDDASSRHIHVDAPLSQLSQLSASVEQMLGYVFGASMLASARFILEVGLMTEDYFLYYEEIDWAMRARGRFTLGYAPESKVFHKSGATSTKVRPGFTTKLYYGNRIRFLSRYFPQHVGIHRRKLIGEFFRHTLRGRFGHARIVASVAWNAPKIAKTTPQTDPSTLLFERGIAPGASS